MKTLSIAWTILLTLSLVLGLTNTEQLNKNLLIVRQIDFWIVLQNIFIITILVVSVFKIYKAHIFFRLSLFSIFNYKEEKETGMPTGKNINTSPFTIKYFGVLFVILMIINVPYFAGIEEEWFRKDLTGWEQGILWSFLFGICHCLVGVPIGVGLLLTFPGLWFTYQYFQGGIELSTIHHTAYNLIVLSVALVGAIVISFQKKEKKIEEIKEEF